eukprot:UN30504
MLDLYITPEKRYYLISAEDTPSRLTQNLQEFSDAFSHSIGYLTKPAIDIIYLTYCLTDKIGVGPSIAFYGYIFVARKIMDFIRHSLPISTAEAAHETQALNSALNAAHERLHTFREPIAMQGGTARERKCLEDRYTKITKFSRKFHLVQLIADANRNQLLKYGSQMCSYTLVVPVIYYNKNIKSPETIDLIMTSFSYMGALGTAMKDIGESLAGVNKLYGLATRVKELEDDLLKIQPSHHSH